MKKLLIPILFLVTSCSLMAQDYFPLAKGNNWAFQIDGYEEVILRFSIVEVLSYEGYDLIRMHFLGEENGMTELIEETFFYNLPPDCNLIYDAFPASGEVDLSPFFQHSPEEGTWTEYGETVEIVEIGTHSVPAGTFQNCYKLEAYFDDYFIFAPNVGFIEWGNYIEDTQTFAEFKLTDYSVAVPPNPCDLSVTPTEKICAPSVQLYPNPASQSITINRGTSDANRLNLTNPKGELLKEIDFTPGTQTVTLDVSNYPPGFYIIQFFNKDQRISSEKIILNN